VNPLARIIDASANRAREALRIMEDVARFALDDAALAAALKDLRHDLRTALEHLAAGEAPLDRAHLLSSRDTPGDVGIALTTPGETRREGLPGIAAAAGARAGEALRVLEEGAKAMGGATAAENARAFEQLRYRAYELEKRLGLALPPARAQWRLCILITESLCRHPWEQVAHAAIRGGADCLQLREKNLDDRQLLARARRLIEIARQTHQRQPPQHAVPSTQQPLARPAIIINDRPDIAVLARADGVHLGQADLPIHEVRKLLGFGMLIGMSTTNLDQARAAVRQGADYCGLGPMFPTTTKNKPEIAGPAYLRDYLADHSLARTPHLAIGGISPQNAVELQAAGCRGIAVSSCVCSAEDPEGVCRHLLHVTG
jgi:thiamine-phosphate pyrophosphorylase